MKRFFFEKSSKCYTFQGIELIKNKTFSLFRKCCDDIDNIVIFNRAVNQRNSIIHGDIISVINKFASEYTQTKSFGTDYQRFTDFQKVLIELFRVYVATVSPDFKKHFPTIVVDSDFSLNKPIVIYHKEGLSVHLFNGQFVDSMVEAIPDRTRFSTDLDYICGNIIINDDVLIGVKYLTATKEVTIEKFGYSKNLSNELKKFFDIHTFYYEQYLNAAKLPSKSFNKTKAVSPNSKKHKTSIIMDGKAVTVTGIKLAEVKTPLQTWQIFYLEDETQEFLIVANNCHRMSERGNYLKTLDELDVPENVALELLSQCGLPLKYLINFKYDGVFNQGDLTNGDAIHLSLNKKDCWINTAPLITKSVIKKDGSTYRYDLVCLDQDKFSIIKSFDNLFLQIINVGGQNDLLRCVAEVESIPFTLEDVYEFITKDYFTQI